MATSTFIGKKKNPKGVLIQMHTLLMNQNTAFTVFMSASVRYMLASVAKLKIVWEIAMAGLSNISICAISIS